MMRFFIMLVMIFSIRLAAQSPVRVEVAVDPDTISIGQMITYSIRVIHDPEWSMAGDPIVDFSDFEVTQIRKMQPEKRGSQIDERREYAITTFNIDTFLIRAPQVYLTKGKDSLLATGTPVQVVVVSSIDSALTDILPEKPLIAGRINWWLLALFAFGALCVVGGVVYLGWWLYRRRQRKTLVPVTEPVLQRTPEELAREKLAKLKQENLPGQGLFKIYHSTISEIVRIYIEQKFAIRALESTTSEIVFSFRNGQVSDEAYLSMIRRFLEVCDLVKFAKYKPDQKECDEVMELALSLIEYHTIPAAPEKV